MPTVLLYVLRFTLRPVSLLQGGLFLPVIEVFVSITLMQKCGDVTQDIDVIATDMFMWQNSPLSAFDCCV